MRKKDVLAELKRKEIELQNNKRGAPIRRRIQCEIQDLRETLRGMNLKRNLARLEA